MRSRTIRPEFWSDEKLGEMTTTERLLFIGLWTFADDEGIVKANPLYLKSAIFPYDNFKASEIDKSIKKFEQEGMVYRYAHNGQQYLWVIKFRVYQRIDKPQKSSNPPPSIQNSNFAKALFFRDNYKCHLCGQYCDGFQLKGEPENPRVASIDHIIPKSKGGSNYPSNLKTSCISCNKSRGNADISEFLSIRGIIQEDSKNIPGTFQSETETETESETESETETIGASRAEKLKHEVELLQKKFLASWNENLEFYRTKYPYLDLEFQWANIADWISRNPGKAKKSAAGDLHLFNQRWLNRERPQQQKPRRPEIRANDQPAAEPTRDERIEFMRGRLEDNRRRLEAVKGKDKRLEVQHQAAIKNIEAQLKEMGA